MHWFEKRWRLPERLQCAEPCIIDEKKLSFSQRQTEVNVLYRPDIKYIGTASCWKYFCLVFFFTISNLYNHFIYIYMNPCNKQLPRAHLLPDNLI